MKYSSVIVGAGISGIRAALDLAGLGDQVLLIDKKQSLGGILSQLDYQFPSDRCGMCKMLPLTERDASSQYCLRKGLFHDNIDLMLGTELTGLFGEPGNFTVTLRERVRFVDPEKCIGCGECSKVCPPRVPSEFNAGLATRPAVYLPVPHSIPNHYVVDWENCERCWECVRVCPTQAIDFRYDRRQAFGLAVAAPEGEIGEDAVPALESENFKLRLMHQPEDALDALENDEGLRLLVLDLDLEDLDVEKALRLAGDREPKVEIVLAAGPDRIDAAQALLRQGAREILTKPLTPPGLAAWTDNAYMLIEAHQTHELETGTVILAGGFESYDCRAEAGRYGYGLRPGVVTSVEFERMVSGAGPTGGRLARPEDGRPIERIAWLQCVGSRDPRIDADFCSSICCMFSIKEAQLARKAGGEGVRTTIFSMDVRTFGKDFQRYRDNAENEGVRFVTCKVHSVEPGENGRHRVRYVDVGGNPAGEEFDLIVLAAGARPSAGTAGLLEVCGAEANEWGFCKTGAFNPAETTRPGVFAAGSFAGPRDIADSVTLASAAAMASSTLYCMCPFAPTRESEPPPDRPDVSREPSRILVALCTACHILQQSLDPDRMDDRLAAFPGVDRVVHVPKLCTRTGWNELKGHVREAGPNRVLIGACLPYAYVPKVRELAAMVRIHPALIDAVDIYTSTYPHMDAGPGIMEDQVLSILRMAAAKLHGSDPSPAPTTATIGKALVVGGGVAGLAAANHIACHGFEAHLVEKADALGGLARRIHRTIEGEAVSDLLDELIDQVTKNPKIHIFKNARIIASAGGVGRFVTTIETEDGRIMPLEHGVTILATGGKPAETVAYGYGQHDSVMTTLELEENLALGRLNPAALGPVAMIQCVDSREEPRNYCSRVCCQSAIKNALTLKERNPDLPVFIFHRDVMTPGFTEAYYTKARRAGVVFIPYRLDEKPRVDFEDGRPVVRALDPVLGREIEIRPDVLALSVGIVPEGTAELAGIFGVETGRDGFFQEAESKWRPVDFLKQGVYLCGTAHSPRSIPDAVASAYAAAVRALPVLKTERVAGGHVAAVVRHSLCSLCELCILACPYQARRVDEEEGIIVVDELACQGCGSCAAVCPNSATVMRGFGDGQMLAVIDAALSGIA